MGRGRQKAKHTKVARELKYNVPDTDYAALERELGAHSHDEDREQWEDYHYPAAEDDDSEDQR